MPHVSSKKSAGVYLCQHAYHNDWWENYVYVCYRCLPFRLATPLGFHVTRIPKANVV